MSVYLPDIAWRTLVSSVVPTSTLHNYTVSVYPLDLNEPGAISFEVLEDDWLIDFAGYIFQVKAVNSLSITVYDINERSWGDSTYGPLEGKEGYIYRSKNNGFALTQAQLRYLDKSAQDIIFPIEKGIIWGYRGLELYGLYDDGVNPPALDTEINITKLTLSSDFILSTLDTGWQGGVSYTLTLGGLLHNTLQDLQGGYIDLLDSTNNEMFHHTEAEIDDHWYDVANPPTSIPTNDIRRDSLVGIGRDPEFYLSVYSRMQVGEGTDTDVRIGFDIVGGELGMVDPDSYAIAAKYGDYYQYGNQVGATDSGLFVKSGKVGVKTSSPADELHVVGHTRISSLVSTGNSVVTANLNGKLTKVDFSGDNSQYLSGDGTFKTVNISLGTYLEAVIGQQDDGTLDPGTPTLGDRYIVEDVSACHTNFKGTSDDIADWILDQSVGDNDIVQWDGSDFIVSFDSSVALDAVTVIVGTDKNGASGHMWTYAVDDAKWINRGAATEHNSLGGLNTGEYIHLTSVEYTDFEELTGGSETTLHTHSASGITSGTLPIARGGTNSSTALNNNRIIISKDSAIVEHTAITRDRALISNSVGIPTHASTTATEIGYVNGVTSSIQTQLNNKQPLDADLTSIAALGFTATAFLTKTAANTWALDTNTYSVTGHTHSYDNYVKWVINSGATSSNVTAGQTVSITGSSPISTSLTDRTLTISHATSGVSANTYNNVTVDTLGHVTGGSNISYLTSVTAHNLLSSTHGDTLTGSVARGDIIVGNSTPKWSRLAFPSSPTGKILQASSTDIAWSTYPITIGTSASISGSNTGDVTLATNSGLQLTGQTLSMGSPTSIAYDDVNSVVGSTHTHAVTANIGFIGNGSARYQTLVTGSSPYNPSWTTSTNIFGTSGLNSLTYASTAFVKMTGTNTFTLDTSTYLTSSTGVTDFRTTLNGLTPSTATNGSVTLAGTLGVSSGGTGKTSFTQYGLVYASASTTLSQVSSGSSGQILRSNGSSAPGWTTATYPSTATTAGQILRASGTDWIATTATYPTTTTANQLLYSSAKNIIGGLTSSNTSALITNSSGVPSFTSGTGANKVLRTNGTTISFSSVYLNTDVDGVLPVEFGGTGLDVIDQGCILFGNGTNDLDYTTNLYFNKTNTRLGIGITAPVRELDVNGYLRLNKTSSGSLSDKGVIEFYNPTTEIIHSKIQGRRGYSESDAGDLAFFTSDLNGVSQERCSINESGVFVIENTLQVKGGSPGANKLLGTGSTSGLVEWIDYTPGTGSNWSKDPSTSKLSYTAANVGIGIALPNEKMELYNSTAVQTVTQYGNSTTGSGTGNGFIVGIESTGNGIVWNRENSYIRFGTNATERIRILSGGNVGINTTTPTETLDINGSCKIGTSSGITVRSSGVIGNVAIASGNIFYGFGTTLTPLSIGTSGHVLYSNGVAPYWGSTYVPYTTLTGVANVFTLNCAEGIKRVMTLTDHSTLAFFNLENGMIGDIKIIVSPAAVVFAISNPSGVTVQKTSSFTLLPRGTYHLCFTYIVIGSSKYLDINFAPYAVSN